MLPETPRRAFTLVEVLVSLMILGLLMGGMAVAMNAYLGSYEENEHVATLTHTARFILSRMMGEVRMAADVDSTATQLTITPVDGSEFQQIQYELADGELWYRRTVSGTREEGVLTGDGADGITVDEFSIVREDSQGGTPLSVKVRLALSRGDESFAVTSSAAIRRNQQY